MGNTSPAIDDFLDLMPSSFTVEPYLSSDDFSVPSYGPGVSYRGRVSYKSTYVRGPNGETIVAKGTIWLGTGDAIGDKDRITAPDGSQPPILNISAVPDETGLTLYTRVDFG